MTQTLDIWGLEAFGEETLESYTESVAHALDAMPIPKDVLERRLYAGMETFLETDNEGLRRLAATRVLWYFTACLTKAGLNLKDLT